MARSISEFCVLVDKCKTDMNELKKLQEYLTKNKQGYLPVNYDFMQEHLDGAMEDLSDIIKVQRLTKTE